MNRPSQLAFHLVDPSYDNQEIIRCIEAILSGQLTMGARVREFEQAFAAKVGAPFAVMVKIAPRFLFVNLGDNLRPTENQAAFGREQLRSSR